MPFLGYPFIVVANIMSLGGEQSADRTFFRSIVSDGFLFGSLVYPLVYVICLILTPLMLAKQSADTALQLSIAPLGYLLIVVFLCFFMDKCR
jgi:fumarate reductase subunit D